MRTFTGLLASASLVAGHGYVTNATIGDSAYTFYQPYTDPYMSPKPDRVSRPVQGNGPITDISLQDLQCGGDSANGVDGSSPAALTASVAAGSTVDLYWTLWPDSHIGPSLTYMAKCANDDCTTFMAESDAVWFKVQEEGRTGTSDVWGTTAIMKAGGSISYTIPDCIEAGQYLVRHEVIALHSAYSSGGAQFYPGCHQITVTGGGSTSPSDLVAFPGAYAADDAGILVDAYKAEAYALPGPSLFSCSGSSNSGSSSSGSSASVVTTSLTVASTTPTVATSTLSVAQKVAAAATTPASSSDDEVTVTSTLPTALATPTAEASSGDESGEEDEGKNDGCDLEATSTTVNTSVAQETGSAASDDEDDDCDAEEQSFARRFHGRFARAL